MKAEDMTNAETVAGLSDDDVMAMLADVWATLDMPGEPARLGPAVAPRITATANLFGDAENRDAALQLLVTVDREAAGLLVAAFFGPSIESAPDEVTDAVGELANMCAGAVKTLLAGEWVIAIPAPADEAISRVGGWVEATLGVQAGWVRLAVGPGAVEASGN